MPRRILLFHRFPDEAAKSFAILGGIDGIDNFLASHRGPEHHIASPYCRQYQFGPSILFYRAYRN